MTMRTAFAAGAAIALMSLTVGVAPLYAIPEKLGPVLASAQRAPESKARDAARHPGESLQFWGLKPGQTVVEISPGGGYWSEILAPYAKQTGGTYIAAFGRPDQKLPVKFEDKAVYGDIKYTVFSKDSGALVPAGSADLVLTARNIHNWLWTPGMAEKAMTDFYAALKPGGILAVEEHRADPRPQNGDARDGYVATSTVIALAQKAGFKLEAQSEINANAKDTKDHPHGVWTLPPVRRSAQQGQPADPNFNRAKYDAIGESDRMTLRFRKPG
jgi:predicted methyltransferase